jgi:hypothetical protein
LEVRRAQSPTLSAESYGRVQRGTCTCCLAQRDALLTAYVYPRSCWDCKKRKVRCTFDETSNTVCISCRRRGAPCIGQDKPEDEIEAYTKASRNALLDRMQKVETLLEKIVDGSHDPGKDGISLGFNSSAHKAEFDYLTPSSNEQSRPSYDPPPSRNTTLDARLCLTDDLTRISEELVKAFPSQADIDILCKSDYVATFYCHQMFTKCGPPENQVIEFVNNIAKIPNPSTTSPVSVAKRMIIFASFLQYFRALGNHGLSEHPTVIMDRLVNTAVRLVSNILGTIPADSMLTWHTSGHYQRKHSVLYGRARKHNTRSKSTRIYSVC